MSNNQSGAALQPGATQPEHEGAAHETKKDCNEFTMQGAAQNLRALAEMTTGKLYSHSELTTLLERMARLVVQEAAKKHVPAHRKGDGLPILGRMICMCGRLKADGVTQWHTLWADHLRAEILSKAQLQQLREAVERP